MSGSLDSIVTIEQRRIGVRLLGRDSLDSGVMWQQKLDNRIPSQKRRYKK